MTMISFEAMAKAHNWTECGSSVDASKHYDEWSEKQLRYTLKVTFYWCVPLGNGVEVTKTMECSAENDGDMCAVVKESLGPDCYVCKIDILKTEKRTA